MSKRSQTTGLPKTTTRKSVPAAAEPVDAKAKRDQTGGRKPALDREFKSRAEREAQIQRYVVLGTIITTVVIVAILLLAIVVDQIIRPNQVVATVSGENITVSEFQKRARLERVFRIEQLTNIITTYQSFGLDPNQIAQQEPYSTWLSELRIPDQLGLSVVNTLVDEEIVRQEAAARGISVSADDVQEQVQTFFGFDPAALLATPTATVEPTITPTPFVSPTPSPTPTVTPTPESTPTAGPTAVPTIPPEPTLNPTQQAEQFTTNRNNYYETLRRDAALSEADVNAYFEQQALREALEDAIAAEQNIGETGMFVNARHILVETEEQAQDVLAALEAGESFAELARSVSTDTSSGANGGELNWSPVTGFVKPFADAVREAPIGEIIGPVESEFGYHIIQVRAREDRELTEQQLTNAKGNAFRAWLEEKRTSLEAEDQVEVFSTWSNYVPNDPPSPFN